VADLWKRVGSEVLAQLSPADGRAVASLIEQFLTDPYNFSNSPRLLYADFAPEHILYDRDDDEISGIIDWGDLAIGDPDYDLTYLYQDYGAAFVARLLVHLSHDEPARLFRKLRAFCAYDYLVDFAANSMAEPDEDTAAALNDAIEGLRWLAREG
jgi:aminoglycoside 2''-phosphotransferase